MSQRQNINAFMNMYKSVSSLNLAKEDRSVKRIFNRTLRTLEVTNGTCPGFTTSEVRAALSNLNPSKAAGPDIIRDFPVTWAQTSSETPPSPGPQGNFVPTTDSQQILGVDIRPTGKNGKDPQKLDSYRPISLTSTILKVMEHPVTNRVRYEVETRRLLSENQAGFRSGRST